MKTEQYLLTVLAEECAEVAQRATKAIRFGLTEVQPGQPHNNAERMLDEIVDLCVILSMLQKDCGLGQCDMSEENLAKKEAKVRRFMDYSRQCGTLQEKQNGGAQP